MIIPDAFAQLSRVTFAAIASVRLRRRVGAVLSSVDPQRVACFASTFPYDQSRSVTGRYLGYCSVA